MDKKIESIFELNYTIENTFFSDLQKTFEVPDNLKGTHIKAMIIIDSGDKYTMSQISHRLNMEKGSFTPVANRLVKLEYIAKIKSHEDKRASYLILTKKGKEFVDALGKALKENIQRKLERLSEEEREAYFAAIRFVLSTTKKIDS